MDDTIIDMRDVFKKLQKQNVSKLKNRSRELLDEILVDLLISMGNITLYTIKNKDEHSSEMEKLKTVQKCFQEINEFIKGRRI